MACFRHVLLAAIVVAIADTRASVKQSSLSASVQGDIILGGLFPVHRKGVGNSTCGEIIPDRGIQRVEAMLYSQDTINKDDSILPNISLGAMIFDTCASSTYALERSMYFIRSSFSYLDESGFYCRDGSRAVSNIRTVAGVIGGSYSYVSMPVANLLRLFKIPQISYASTSASLSDKSRFNYFVRTVPSDMFQALVSVDLVQFFNWTYVFTVFSEGEYGESAIEFFETQARDRNICIAESIKVSSKPTSEEVNNVVDSLVRKRSAKVVILFLHGRHVVKVLSEARRRNISNRFTWVASDSWGTRMPPIGDNHEVAEGALTIVPKSAKIPEFSNYFLNLKPRENQRNPWFREYWEFMHGCKWQNLEEPITDPAIILCTGDEVTPRSQHKQEPKVQFIYDAVLTIALAIDKLIKDKCNEYSKECGALKSSDGETLLQDYILKSTFDDGYGRVVKFDKNGDAVGRYSIMNYQLDKETNEYSYKHVGTWDSSLSIDVADIVWVGGSADIPISRCSRPCDIDEKKEIGEDGDLCCWVCIKCKPWEYLKNEFTCEDCGVGRWPHAHHRTCYDLEVQYMTFDSVYSVTLLALSGIGIAATGFVMLTFVLFNDTPIVRASGRELSYLLLTGCLFCYLMTTVLILKPSADVCTAQRFGVGFGFAVIYSSLLTKTIRISRIFESAKTTARRPPFVSPKSQVTICLVFISLQVVFAGIWLVLQPPGTRVDYSNEIRDEIILKCITEDVAFLASLSYNAVLIIACTVYAIKTRKVPENFNESKFIGFTMYTTCIVWLAFVPIYFGTLDSFKVQRTTLCACVSLSASIALVCLFTPKMYIIWLRPEKNVRTRATSSLKSTAVKSIAAAPKNYEGGISTVSSVSETQDTSSKWADRPCTSSITDERA